MEFFDQLNQFTSTPSYQAFNWLVMLVSVVSMWKLFLIAHKPGWASIVPIYNLVVVLQIVGRPTWWIILFLIPIVNIVIALMVLYEFVQAYGKGLGFFFGVIFLGFIFYPVLAFSEDTKYIGNGNPVTSATPPQTTSQPPMSEQTSDNSKNQPPTPPQV